MVGNSIPNSEVFKDVTAMIRIYVGISTRSTDISPLNTYKAAKIISHPDFNENSYKNDLSIVILDRDVDWTDPAVSFICLDRVTQTSPGTVVYAVGWGFTEKNWFKASDSLKQVSFPIKTESDCGITYIPVYQFCAGNHILGKDTCNVK